METAQQSDNQTGRAIYTIPNTEPKTVQSEGVQVFAAALAEPLIQAIVDALVSDIERDPMMVKFLEAREMDFEQFEDYTPHGRLGFVLDEFIAQGTWIAS